MRATTRLTGLSAALACVVGGAGPAVHIARVPAARAPVTHVVEIMLENHTFDNLFPPAGAPGGTQPVSAPPNEGDVQGGIDNSRAAEFGAMDFRRGRGYLMDRFTDPPFGVQAITTFGPGFDPDLQYLAGSYELAGRNFQPVVGPTGPNVLMALNGTAHGWYSNQPDPHPGPWYSIFDELTAHGRSWKIYYALPRWILRGTVWQQIIPPGHARDLTTGSRFRHPGTAGHREPVGPPRLLLAAVHQHLRPVVHAAPVEPAAAHPPERAVAAVWLHPAPAPQRLRRHLLGDDRAGPDHRHRGRLPRTGHAGRLPYVRGADRRPPAAARPVPAVPGRPDHARRAAGVRRAGLVHRGGHRCRGGARHGPGRRRALRRRRQLLLRRHGQRPRHRRQPPPRHHREQLLERTGRQARAGALRHHLPAGRERGHRLLLLLGRPRVQLPTGEPQLHPPPGQLPQLRPLGHLGGRHQSRDRQEPRLRVRDRLGTLSDPLSASGTAWSPPPPGRYPADYRYSGGGGVSTIYRQPFYQRAVVPASMATHLPDGSISATPMRVTPDVSAVADPGTGFLTGLTALQPDGRTYAFSLARYGGTSVACPVFAGIEADAQQAAGYPLGFANPAIYARYRTAAFRDVTDQPLGHRPLFLVTNSYTDPAARKGPLVTGLVSLGINGGGAAALEAVGGYDDATGVGSPYQYVQSFGW